MNFEETKQLLAKAALVDNRTASQAVIMAWQETLADLPYEDALAALTLHRRESTEWLTPAHITGNIRRVRDARRIAEARQRQIAAAQRVSQNDAENTPAGPVTGLPARLRQKYDKEFQEGLRLGNAVRTYHTVLRETGDARKAAAAKTHILNTETVPGGQPDNEQAQ